MTGVSRQITELILRDCVEQHFLRALSHYENKENRAIAARFAATSLITLIVKWVECEFAITPARLQATYQALVGGGLKEFASQIARDSPHQGMDAR